MKKKKAVGLPDAFRGVKIFRKYRFWLVKS